MKKNCLFLLLLFLLVFAVAVGCGEVNDEDFSLEFSPDGEGVDFDGFNVKIVNENPSYILGVVQDTLLYDCVLQRFDDIEEKLNCVITIETTANYTAHEGKMRTEISAGLKPGEIIQLAHNNPAATFAYAGLLLPLTEVQHILDFENSEKYGSPAILECAMYNGVPYAVMPVSWFGNQEGYCFFIAYNRDKIRQIGQPVLHEYYENQTWTWETFENVLETYHVNDNETSIQTISAPGRGMSQAILLSNGVKLADYIDGKFQSDLYQPKTLNAIAWMQKIYNDYPGRIVDVAYWSAAEFMNGDTLTVLASGGQVTTGELQTNCDFPINIMPFPSGPDVTYGQWAHWREGINAFCIPITIEEPEVAAYVISELFEPFAEFGGEDLSGIREYYDRYVFMDSLDTEIFFSAGQYSRYVYWHVGGLDFASNVAANFKSSSAQELIEQFAPQMEGVIGNYILPNFENYIYEHLYK